MSMRTFAFSMIAALTAPAALADADIFGTWRTPMGAHVEISDCGDGAPCGELVQLDPGVDPVTTRDANNKDETLRDRLLLGVELLSGFSAKKARWVDGSIYNPRDGETYSATLWLQTDDQLRLKACLIWPACRTQDWVRVGP